MAVTQISPSQADELNTNPGYLLRPDAANAWDRAVGDFGKQVLITGALRSYQTQVEIFDSELYPATGRYVRGNHAGERGFTSDVRGRTADGGLYRGSWWTRKAGTASAAVPGTSNHGGGVAVDVKTRREDGDPGYDEAVVFGSWDDQDRTSFLRVAEDHGWADDEGRSVSELWHLTYYPDRDKHKGEKPKPLPKDEFMPKLTDIEQQRLANSVEQIESIVREMRDLNKKQRAADLKYMSASASREGRTLAKVNDLQVQVAALRAAQA